MRKLLLILFFATACITIHAQQHLDVVWSDQVKSVQLYRNGAELDFPILLSGQHTQLVLEFDLLGPEAASLGWRIRHCDSQWNPDQLEPNEFLTGLSEGMLDEYDFSFNTRVDYVHYRASLPGTFAEFTYSGNYIVEVFSTDDMADGRYSKPLLRRRFCVAEQAVDVKAEVTQPYDGIDRDRRQEVDVLISGQVNEQWLHVLAMQNGREDTRRPLRFSGFDRQSLAYRYKPENIFWAGNNYRYFDCSNLGATMYNVVHVEDYGGQLYAILKPDENRSRKHFISETTLFGGWKTNVRDRQTPRLEADYVWVNFSLPMSQPMLEGSIYIVGGLTDWHLDSTSRMDYNPQLRAYTKRLLLKQGYYSYQLLVDSPRLTVSDSKSALLEGDHRETPNTYTIFVYQHSPADQADRLLAVKKVTP